jgi:hypothetical protein
MCSFPVTVVVVKIIKAKASKRRQKDGRKNKQGEI